MVRYPIKILHALGSLNHGGVETWLLNSLKFTDRERIKFVYGLGGEALLDFGPLGVPLAFAIYGAILGWYRRKFATLYWQDARVFLAPLFTILFATALVGDSENVIFAAITEGALIFAALLAASTIGAAPQTG